MADRIEFLSKYRHLETSWGIDGTTLSGILISANEQLINEILDDTPFTISRYHRDGRNDHEYIYDIIDGRAMEKILVEWLNNRGIPVERSGSDADDKIHRSAGKKITSQFDLEAPTHPRPSEKTAHPSKIEVQLSSLPRSEYHIKKYKGDRLIKQGGLVMFLIIPEDTYFLVDKEELVNSKIEYNPRWQKECYVIIPKKYYPMGGKK